MMFESIPPGLIFGWVVGVLVGLLELIANRPRLRLYYILFVLVTVICTPMLYFRMATLGYETEYWNTTAGDPIWTLTRLMVLSIVGIVFVTLLGKVFLKR